MRKLLLITALALINGPVHAMKVEEIVGHVHSVQSGDALTLVSGKRRIVVKLADIEAPAKGKPMWQQSRDSLEATVKDMELVVASFSKNAAGKRLGRVFTKDGVDVNRTQVCAGMAVQKHEVFKDSLITECQLKAKAEKVGVWR